MYFIYRLGLHLAGAPGDHVYPVHERQPRAFYRKHGCPGTYDKRRRKAPAQISKLEKRLQRH